MTRNTKFALGVLATFVLAPVLLFAGAIGVVWWQTRPIGLVDDDLPYLERRAKLVEQRAPMPAPQPFESDGALPVGVQDVRFLSNNVPLRAWYRPATTPGKPALVFLHGGFAFEAEDFTQLALFLDDGWAVMAPTYRGENGNPGHFELFLGEVDDAANAVRWLAHQPGIDPTKIVVLGHSAGGGVAAMLSLVPDLPVALTASAGGFYEESISLSWQDMVPFDPMKRESRRIRVLHPHVKHMQRKHVAWVGADDVGLIEFAREAKPVLQAYERLVLHEIPGDHHSSLPAIFAAFKQEVAGVR